MWRDKQILGGIKNQVKPTRRKFSPYNIPRFKTSILNRILPSAKD